MKKLLIITFLSLITVNMLAQKGTRFFLDEKNGFKCFKLADRISNYMNVVKPVEDEPGTYSVKDSTLLLIGEEIKLSHIFIKTFNDSIYSISLMAKPEYKHKIRNVLIAAFGAWNYQPNKFMERYYWMSGNQNIELLYDASNHQWCIVTYKNTDLDLRKGKSDHQKDRKTADDI